MIYDLQNRWVIEGKTLVYFGLRKQPNTLKHRLNLSKKMKSIIQTLPRALTKQEMSILKPLLRQDILVTKDKKRQTPSKLEDAQFCASCVANDFMIPGLEFTEDGICPMCDSKEITKNFKSVLPVLNRPEPSKKSRFDIALFYTGGKDSSYLLYYLSKILKLKVLALTWEIPFMSDSARKSIENAKKKLKNVEFVSRKIADSDLKLFYDKLYDLSGNTCACPSLAYMIFYPLLVDEKVPYFVAGNEPAQLLNLYFNGFAPKIAFSESTHKYTLIFYNIGRILTLRKPLKKGQIHTLMTMKSLAYKEPLLKRLSKYKQEIISNIIEALKTIPLIKQPLRKALRRSSLSGKIPAFIQIDFNDITDGLYDWQEAMQTIRDEIDWVGPEESDKALHTSCRIEKCKDHTQFLNFYYLKSHMIPFSALEISIASQGKNLTKKEAIDEITNHLGFSLSEITECQIMKNYLSI